MDPVGTRIAVEDRIETKLCVNASILRSAPPFVPRTFFAWMPVRVADDAEHVDFVAVTTCDVCESGLHIAYDPCPGASRIAAGETRE